LLGPQRFQSSQGKLPQIVDTRFWNSRIISGSVLQHARNLNHTGSIGTLIRIKLTRRGELTCGTQPTQSKMKRLLLGYRDNMRVEIESGVAVTAKPWRTFAHSLRGRLA
jgi:hypothetical protein